MKIAFFTDSYYPMLNGVTISVANLAAELRALGHTVYIFAPKFDNYIDTEKDVYRLKAIKVLDTEPVVHMPFLLPHQIFKEIHPRDFDIVHAHGNGFFSLLGYQMARMKGVPFILTFHTQLTRYTHYVLNGKIVTPRMAGTALRIFGNICDSVVTPSEKMKTELTSYGVKKPISVVPNFVQFDKFQVTEKGFLRDLCGIPAQAEILVSVGRLGQEKNFPFLLQAFKNISAENKTVHLVIVGDGEEASQIKEYAKKLHIGNRLHFTGRINSSDMPKVYADSDIFVFSSTTEVHPMVVLEAAAAGLPFVVVEDGAYENIIIEGENGYATSQKVPAFSDKVLMLLDDAEKRKKFGQASKRIIKENFAPRNLALAMLKTYEDTLSGRKPSRLNFRSINKTAIRRLYTMTDVLDRIFQ